jgi:excisionase family DNA binding protein
MPSIIEEKIYERKEGHPMIELNGENYLDGREASHLLGVKLSTLYTYVSRGILRSYKQGIKRQRLYKQVELEALLRLRPSSDSASSFVTQQERGELPHAEDWVPNV